MTLMALPAIDCGFMGRPIGLNLRRFFAVTFDTVTGCQFRRLRQGNRADADSQSDDKGNHPAFPHLILEHHLPPCI